MKARWLRHPLWFAAPIVIVLALAFALMAVDL